MRYSSRSRFPLSPLSRSNQWSRPAVMREVPSRTIVMAPTPKGAMSCDRLTGPLGIVVAPLVQVQPGYLGLARSIDVAHGHGRGPGDELPLAARVSASL